MCSKSRVLLSRIRRNGKANFGFRFVCFTFSFPDPAERIKLNECLLQRYLHFTCANTSDCSLFSGRVINVKHRPKSTRVYLLNFHNLCFAWAHTYAMALSYIICGVRMSWKIGLQRDCLHINAMYAPLFHATTARTRYTNIARKW